MKIRFASSHDGWTTLSRSSSTVAWSTQISYIPRISCQRLVSLTINRNEHTQLVTWVGSDRLMKCPPPWPLPKSHWICSECNLDCILVLFYHCFSNPSLPLSSRYHIWSEKLHWTERVKTTMLLAISGPHLKDVVLQGFVCLFVCLGFLFYFLHFSQIRIFEEHMNLLGFVQRQTSGRDFFWKIVICFLHRQPPTAPQDAACMQQVPWLATFSWCLP